MGGNVKKVERVNDVKSGVAHLSSEEDLSDWDNEGTARNRG